MKHTHIAFVSLALSMNALVAQTASSSGPYQIKSSAEFEIPKRHRELVTIDYGATGTLQVFNHDLKSMAFWMFDNKTLALKKENIIEPRDMFDGRLSYNSFLRLKTRTYLMMRDVQRESGTEGITAVEFSPSSLNLVGKPQPLYQSSDKVVVEQTCVVSEDRSKFMYYYTLRREEKRNKFNKDRLGFQVFNENLGKVWGGEYEMPYTEAMMSLLDVTLTDEGQVLMLAKVYGNDNGNDVYEDRLNFRYEVLSYEKQNQQPVITRVRMNDSYYLSQSLLYEDANHELVLTGFFRKTATADNEGTYMARLGKATGGVFQADLNYYEIPNAIIKEHTSRRAQKRIDKKDAKGAEIGIPWLTFRKTFAMADHSTIVVAEQYRVTATQVSNGKTSSTTYRTDAWDVYITKFDASGKTVWVRKISKHQHCADPFGLNLSLNATAIDGKVNLFYTDHIENADLPAEEEAKGTSGYGKKACIVGVQISQDGTVQRHAIGLTTEFESPFFLRKFDLTNTNNLIGSGYKKRKGYLYTIQVK